MNTLTTRWLIARDMEAALEVGAMIPWDIGDLRGHCRQRNNISMACEDDHDVIVGHIAYSLMPHAIHIVNIAADEWEREWWSSVSEWEIGPAYALMQRVLNGMVGRRDLITVNCPDDQDDILCFFRDCGFLVWQQSEGIIHMRYVLPIETELTSIGGEVCRRSSGLPCMLPEEIVDE